MKSEQMMAAHLKAVNEMLVGASPAGAYCLGLGTSAGFSGGWLPTRTEMEELLRCKTVEEGEAVVSRLTASHTRPPNEEKGTE